MRALKAGFRVADTALVTFSGRERSVPAASTSSARTG
jgi:hypothetical protein